MSLPAGADSRPGFAGGVSLPAGADSRPGFAGRDHLPRLGFLGLGWIGRQRMQAIAASGTGRVVAVADTDGEAASRAAHALGDGPSEDRVHVGRGLEDLLVHDLDGVVIATPSAQHAEQSLACLRAGVAVFCQKPLARTAAETEQVLQAARAADRLLGVDLSYRHTRAAQAVRAQVAGGAVGKVFAVDLTFHNAYGPDKPWFSDPASSGGGCVIDLATHLVDLGSWILGDPALRRVHSRLYTAGAPWSPTGGQVETFAFAQLDLADGTAVRLACSWYLSAGRDAVLEAAFYGTEGAVRLENVAGSFYDLRALRSTGTTEVTLVEPPDEWGGRAAVAWARTLGHDGGFDGEAEHLLDLARAIDAIYAAAPCEC